MSWLRAFAVSLVLGTNTVACASGVDSGTPVESSSAGDLCARACQMRLERGCVTDAVLCAATCVVARAAGYCSAELDTHLACVADAVDLHCGRTPNGGSCDPEGGDLEHCLAAHAVGDLPPDCYGKACNSQCGPIGKALCAPGKTYLCECPSGASGERRCSDDGCFWLPCECAP
jgi:hypothetical protein